MKVQAQELYKTLKSAAPIPKTFEIEETTVCTDALTGRRRQKKKRHKYAVIGVNFGEHELTVDYYGFRGVLRTLGKERVHVYSRGQFLDVDYGTGGSLSLVPLDASSDVILNLNTLCIEKRR